MHWFLSHQYDRRAAALADRHYSRQQPGTPKFMPPGRQLVLITRGADAVWGWSYPDPRYVARNWAECWLCCLFRNESPLKASVLIRQAVSVALYRWGRPAGCDGILAVTMIDESKVRPVRVRGRDVFGFCYRKAGWVELGRTKKRRLLVLGLPHAELSVAECYAGCLLSKS